MSSADPGQRDSANSSAAVGRATLLSNAAAWAGDALTAWVDGDYRKVSALAPLAVEHMGKAVLWARNPVLLTPLSSDAESSLLALATKPDLTNPKMKTIGLLQVLMRLEQVLGNLPMDASKRRRMVDVRNGAIHGASAPQSRYVLLDALAVCMTLLDALDMNAQTFFGRHYDNVMTLLDEKRTEVGHDVAAKRARARTSLNALSEQLDDELFADHVWRREEQGADLLDPRDFGTGLHAIDHRCPECARNGRLFGEVDVEPEVEFDHEPNGLGGWDATPYVAGWTVTLLPKVFGCNVCGLRLNGPAELAEGALPSARITIDAEELSNDFDPAEYAQLQAGYDDYY